MKWIINRWKCEGGYRDVLKIAIPLILSTGAWTIQHFVDRMFLTWYSEDAIAASMPAGMVNFAFLSFFIGTASYVNTFVAQYSGAKQYDKIGQAVWQGIYLSVIGMFFMFACIPFAESLFHFAGHPESIQELEVQYFIILCMGSFFPIAASALSGFFSGLGYTWIVMWVNVVATILNIILDYAMIFGNWGFSEMGIEGAAIATVFSGVLSFSLFFILMLRGQYRQKYLTWIGRNFSIDLFKRLWKFGSPSGFQFFLDMVGFSIFVLLIGRLGRTELAASNIAFQINTLAFMPMLGFGIAVSVMVGQNIGNKNPRQAEFSTWSAAHLTFFYMITISLLYVLIPELFLMPFGLKADPVVFQKTVDYGIVLLKFIALYSIFDALNIIFASAVKGAGDTKFVMIMSVVLSWTVMVVPTYLSIVVFEWDLFAAWWFATAYVIILGFLFLFRFLQGKWKHMSVIEEPTSTSFDTPKLAPAD